VERYDTLQQINKAAQDTDTLATDINKKIVDIPMVSHPDMTENDSEQCAKDSHMI